MADLDLSVTVTRDFLGLPVLELNDDPYQVARTFLGAGVTWERNKVSSPWVDGDLTVSARRGQVNETIQIEIFGDTAGELQSNHDDLIAAFVQARFRLDISIGPDAHYAYRCEAADYKLSWVPERFVAGQLQVEFQVPRHPVPYAGVA